VNPVLWSLSLTCLLLAFVVTGAAIWWSRPPTIIDGNGDATYRERFRAPAALGAGLLLTTLAGLFALIGTPPA
jgi:uncharacterized iron-regulated membrane protein